ncbi:MAG: N-acetylmuramoyl-L-alanine amidase [Actinomycetota bacterium]
MDLIRAGQHGEAVRDVQQRLIALGYPVGTEEREGSFGPQTQAAVRAFQQARRLRVDDLVGPDTWRELVEASYQLGRRLLYLRGEPLRGDDVVALQARLNALGFDAGREDGILGAKTDLALRQFQRNVGLLADGICGESTVIALQNLRSTVSDVSASHIREREAWRARPHGLPGLRVMLDPGHGGEDPGGIGPAGVRESDVCFEIVRRLAGRLQALGCEVLISRRSGQGPDEHVRARIANEADVDVFVSVHANCDPSPSAEGSSTYYFGSESFVSEAGMRLAGLVQEEITSQTSLPDGRTHAKAFPILRETRMAAVLVEPAFISNPAEEKRLAEPAFQDLLAAALAQALAGFAANPCDTGSFPALAQ